MTPEDGRTRYQCHPPPALPPDLRPHDGRGSPMSGQLRLPRPQSTLQVSLSQSEASVRLTDQSHPRSDWGWCQWTDQYGDQGPRDRLETAEAGACSTDKDCSPRFPVCSNLGYCTVKDYFKVMFIKHAVTKQSILGSDGMTLTFML